MHYFAEPNGFAQTAITNNPAIQHQIEKMVSVVIDVENNKATDDNAKKAFELFKNSTGLNDKDLLLQLLFFKEHLNNDDSDRGRAVRVLIGSVYPAIPLEDLTKFVASALDNTEEPVQMRDLTRLLDGVVFKKNPEPDFSVLAIVIKGQKDAPSPSLIHYMFHLEPEKAAITLAQVYSDDKAVVELQNVLRTDAVDVINILSISSNWWQRLYVAETIRKNPQLRNPEILNRLQQDEHPLIRKVLAEIKGDKTEKLLQPQKNKTIPATSANANVLEKQREDNITIPSPASLPSTNNQPRLSSQPITQSQNVPAPSNPSTPGYSRITVVSIVGVLVVLAAAVWLMRSRS